MGRRSEGTAAEEARLGRADSGRPQSGAARKRAAVELVARHEGTLKRTARRYSLAEEDAEDAYQRALEIVLTKAPTTDPRELIRWTQTVTKHEALAVREGRERLLGRGTAGERSALDPVALIPSPADGPDEQTERRESIARSREALRALKPAELRALTLLAQGYSYAEIGAVTGFSRTKVNRLLAEGRDRFRRLLSSSEDGTRCRELRPLLSAFCDGEASSAEEEVVREHLRACGGCRSTMKAYRAAPRIAAGLVPALPLSRTLLERLRELLDGLSSRLPGFAGGGGDTAAGVAAAGGSGGLGMAGAVKLLAVCAGAAGGAACVATGVVPTPLDASAQHRVAPVIERSVAQPLDPAADAAPSEAADTTRPKPPADPAPEPERLPAPEAEVPVDTAEAAGTAEAEAAPAASEPVPPPAPAPSPEPASGSAAGEFGP